MNLQANLSKREDEVAGYLATGYAKKEIASHLHISERTVENTARHIYEKAQVRSIGQLCAWWFCKTFNIPHQGLPTITFPKIQAMAMMMLCLLILNEIFSDSSYVRRCSGKTAKVVEGKRGKRKCDDDENTIAIDDAIETA